MALNRRSLLENWVLSPLGGSALPAELAVSDLDILQALMTYYRYNPIKVTRTYEFRNQRELTVPYSSIVPAPVNDEMEYYYLGVIQAEPRTQMMHATMDSYLLGPSHVSLPKYDPSQIVAYASLIDSVQGDLYYEDQSELEQIKYVVGGYSVLNVIYAVGQTSLNYIPFVHLELVARLASIPYYQRVLAIRKTGKFQHTDFQISTEQLEAALKYAETEKVRGLAEVGLMAITKG